jgi:hypothetical protein
MKNPALKPAKLAVAKAQEQNEPVIYSLHLKIQILIDWCAGGH